MFVSIMAADTWYQIIRPPESTIQTQYVSDLSIEIHQFWYVLTRAMQFVT